MLIKTIYKFVVLVLYVYSSSRFNAQVFLLLSTVSSKTFKDPIRLLSSFQDNFFGRLITFTAAAQNVVQQRQTKVVPNRNNGENVALDVIFVMDTSASITRQRFDNHLKPFPNMVAQYFLVSPLHTKVGAIAFGYRIYVISHLTGNLDNFNREISRFVYRKGGGTNTGQALLRAIEMFNTSGRPSANSKRVVILLTDGHRNMGPNITATAEKLKLNAIEVFAFGLGSAVNEAELHTLASPPSDRHVFLIKSFRLFRNFTLSIVPSKDTNKLAVADPSGRAKSTNSIV